MMLVGDLLVVLANHAFCIIDSVNNKGENHDHPPTNMRSFYQKGCPVGRWVLYYISGDFFARTSLWRVLF